MLATISKTEIKLDYAETTLDEPDILEENNSVTVYYYLDNFKTTKIQSNFP